MLNHWLRVLNITQGEILFKFKVVYEESVNNRPLFFLFIRNLASLVIHIPNALDGFDLMSMRIK